jgi:hypothetical protein
MNWESLLGLALVLTVLVLIIQRAEPGRRRLTALIMLAGMETVRRFAVYRGWSDEALWAFVIALVFNALFWAMIGRNNPPRSSEEIEVLGNE